MQYPVLSRFMNSIAGTVFLHCLQYLKPVVSRGSLFMAVQAKRTLVFTSCPRFKTAEALAFDWLIESCSLTIRSP